MTQEILNHIESARAYYHQEQFHEELVAAREEYHHLVGKLDEDHENFELLLQSFDDWYLCNYQLSSKGRSPLNDYVLNSDIVASLSRSLLNVHYGLYEYQGKGKFYDLFHDEELRTNSSTIMLIKGEIFSGRRVSIEKDHVFLPGMCIVPLEAKKILLQKMKPLKKDLSKREIYHFLIKVEHFLIRYRKFKNLPLNQIFSFST